MTTSLDDLKLHGSGKVREIYEDGDELIMVASDRISVYDVILPTEIPDKGKVLTQMSLFWFELTEDDRPQPLHLRGRPAGGRWPGHAGPASSTCTRSSAWSAAISPDRDGRSTASPAPSAASTCRRDSRSPSKLPEPIFTPATKAELGEHDENIDFDRAAELIGDRPLMEELRRRLDRDLRARPRTTPPSAGSSSPTPSSSSAAPPARTSSSPTRSSPRTPRASGPPTSTSPAAPRPPSTSSTSATTRTRSAGTTPSRAPSCPTRSSQNTRAKYVEAYEKITGRNLGDGFATRSRPQQAPQ